MRSPEMPRRKGTVSRTWLVVPSERGAYVEEVRKHGIMRRTGLPARDLRVLDPLLSYPCTIMGRERAIVINFEHIKAIITATEVLVPNFKHPMAVAFVQDLEARVSNPHGESSQQVSESSDMVATSCPDHQRGVPQEKGTSNDMSNSEMGEGCPSPPLKACRDAVKKVVPFEFRALEVCLESACRCLESETSTLEQEAYPVLDELTSIISMLNVDHVRQIKSRLVEISGRVQKARDELEHLLDDDTDMAEMYLTEKLLCQPAGQSSRVILESDAVQVGEDRDQDDFKDDPASSHGSLGNFKPNIRELEMLLEAYFIQIDGTLNKLSTLREYVDDTEDYINIMLDDKQNELLQMGAMVNMGTFAVTAGVVVVGLFGMNISIELFNAPFIKFWETTFGSVVGCLVLYILGIAWSKKSGLLR